MSSFSEIKPVKPQRVMDLVGEAGVDISDWENFKGGPSRAASNPKYCYEWAFIEDGKIVVLNLWHANMQEIDGAIVHKENIRQFGVSMGGLGRSNLAIRARRLDLALQASVRERLPIRVIILDGSMSASEDPASKASRVQNRILDPVPWAVTEYSWETGLAVITRGALPDRFVDQFSATEIGRSPETRWSEGESYVRDPVVRRTVLERAGGRCEYCKTMGFVMADGRIFLESHHAIPLSEGGPDTVANVVALCPNHHREAHYGKLQAKMREDFLMKKYS